jgi:hypothetical protein
MAEPTPPPSRRRPRRPGLLASLALVVAVLLCGGGGTTAFIVVQQEQPRGGDEPRDAIEGFLEEVFTNHSAAGAAQYVCPQARDAEHLNELVTRVAEFQDRFNEPRTRWEYPPVEEDGRRAAATVTLTLTTADEQEATRKVRLLLVEIRGWWVCDAEPAS